MKNSSDFLGELPVEQHDKMKQSNNNSLSSQSQHDSLNFNLTCINIAHYNCLYLSVLEEVMFDCLFRFNPLGGFNFQALVNEIRQLYHPL